MFVPCGAILFADLFHQCSLIIALCFLCACAPFTFLPWARGSRRVFDSLPGIWQGNIRNWFRLSRQDFVRSAIGSGFDYPSTRHPQGKIFSVLLYPFPECFARASGRRLDFRGSFSGFIRKSAYKHVL
jgi:hypothetical protein